MLHEKLFLFLLRLKHHSGPDIVHFRMVSEFAKGKREQEGKYVNKTLFDRRGVDSGTKRVCVYYLQTVVCRYAPAPLWPSSLPPQPSSPPQQWALSSLNKNNTTVSHDFKTNSEHFYFSLMKCENFLMTAVSLSIMCTPYR